MTKSDFIEAQSAEATANKWLTWTFLAIFFLATFSWEWITDQVNLGGVAWLMEVVKYPWAVGFAYFLLFGFVVNWKNNHRMKGAGMICASCQAPLLAHLASIAIATGNCGKCGKRAFDDLTGPRDLEYSGN